MPFGAFLFATLLYKSIYLHYKLISMKKRKTDSKGECSVLFKANAAMMTELDKLAAKEGRTIKGYLNILIEREVQARSGKAVR